MNKESSVIQDTIIGETKPDSDFSKVVETLLNDRHRRRKTILSNRQVSPITTLDVIGQIYDLPFLKKWVKTFSEWRTSGDGGKGRNDIVEISKFHYDQEQQRNSDLLDAVRGRK